MILTFIGMSGAGKTFWATKLAAQGFTCFHCDALLATRLPLPEGYGSSLTEIGRWMGLPYEADFRRREALYLACEAEVLRDVVTSAARCASSRTNCVIDTGGSAIYADAAIFAQLSRLSTVIYLTIPAALHPQMVLSYLDNPRPLIWNGLFNQEPHESLRDAAMRCYTQLLRHRDELYQRYSHVQIEYDYYRQPSLTAGRLLQHIRAATAHPLAAGRRETEPAWPLEADT